ncbi:MAG: DUF4230 domain-containing protein [Bacteroidaceae bacterium]|nr:DUF4230 domain-containing protein [Bacteroidaceae bacterium]
MRDWLTNKKLAGILIGLALSIIMITLTRRCTEEDEEMQIPVEETIASIEDVRLRGELYVCSAMMEDYTLQQATERNLLWADEVHSCVQTMTQKCSYKIDLDKVEYLADDSAKTVYVKLPAIEYVAMTQSSSFLSDDSNYWSKHLPNTNALKRKVEAQIKRRFDTSGNRRKAERYAEDAISGMLGKLGYETEFVRILKRKAE